MRNIYMLLLVCISLKVEAQTSTFSYVDSLLESGRYKQALTKLKQVDTLHYIVNYKIGNIYVSIDDYVNASLYYKKSLLYKDSKRVQKALAIAYNKTKQYKKAIQIYEQLSKLDSEDLLIQYRLGKLYFITNNLANASKVFSELTKRDPENPNYYYQLGLIAARKHDGNGMLDNFLRAYKSDTTHIKSIYQLAKTFGLIRKRDSSRLFTDRGLQLDSLHINLNKLKINSFFREKEYQKAISRLHLLDSILPNDLYVKKMLARSYYNIDSLDLAQKNFEIARNLDKEDFKILTYLGHIFKSKKEYQKAYFSYFRATLLGKKERSEEYYSMGVLQLEMKLPKRAILSFDKALKENRYKYKALYQKALTADSYYRDKKIAYKLYDEYILSFEEKDKDITTFVKKRMKEIKEMLFMKGKKVE
ncbi:MAG: tetratricopeptide repeat protein [Flavobacteriaceae bacterium]|nr:tetratricopeptide repeat protein [Flavobacteriaceae bacterium]